MATRVNKKLLVIVSSCTAIAIGVVALVVVQQWRGDPMRHIRAGDAFAAQGEFRRAAGEYGRAVGKRSGEIAFYAKYLDAMGKVVPTSMEDARESYSMWAAFLLKQAQVARTDEKLWRRIVTERQFQSELNDSGSGWDALANLAKSDILDIVRDDPKLSFMANAALGYALARNRSALTPEELEKAVVLLEDTAKNATGEDQDLAFGGLLTIRLSQAQSATRSGQQRAAADAWKVFGEVYQRAVASQPNGLQVLKHSLQRLIAGVTNPGAVGGTPVTPGDITLAVDRLLARALEIASPLSVLEAAKSVANEQVPEGLQKASILLKEYVDKHPNAVAHRRALALTLSQDEPAAAEREAMAIIEQPQLPVSFEAAIQSEMRVAAAMQLFDLDFSRASSLEKGPERNAVLTKLDASLARIKDLARGLGDDSAVLKAEGKRAYVAGDASTAYVKLNEVIRKGVAADGEVYFLLSILAEERGETGLAEEFIGRGLELAPGSPALAFTKGRLALRNGKLDIARAIFSEILARDPSNAEAKRLLAATQAATGADDPTSTPEIMRKLSDADMLRVKGDTEGALKIMHPLLEQHPDNLRVIILGALCEAQAKNVDAAKALVERGYKQSPGNSTLRTVEMLISSDDPTVRVMTTVAREHPEEPDRTVWTAIRLAQVLTTVEAEIKRLEVSSPAEAALRKEGLAGMKAAREEWAAKANAVGAAHPAWLDFRLTNALVSNDIPAAEAVVADAERAGSMPATEAMFKARVALVKGNNGEAATILQKAIDSNYDDAAMFQLLGSAYERMGDPASALKSYAEAYRRKPTDLSIVRFYVGTLVRSGDRTVALNVLREARKISGEDLDIGESWLDLEREIGDRQLARNQRKLRYELVPGDRTNAKKYATMLAELEPVRADIVGSDDKVKYTDNAWRALDEQTRQAEIQRVREKWQAASDEIFTKLIASDPLGLEVVMLRAATARKQGRYELGEGAIRTLIKDAGDKVSPQMWVTLGVHLAEMNENVRATEAFAEAVKLQDDSKREADISISEYYFQRSAWQPCLDHLARVFERRQDRQIQLRMAEVYGRLNRFAEAKEMLSKLSPENDQDVILDQLQASLADNEARDLARQGKKEEALKVLASGVDAAKRAAGKQPANPVIPVQEAGLHGLRFEISGDVAAIDAGIAAADRAVKLRGDYWGGSQAKSELLLAKGSVAESINELERFVKASPSVAEGRRRLIELLYGRARNTARAIELGKEAVSIAPNDPQWRLILADVYLATNQPELAISSYEQADRLRPSAEILSRLTDLRMRQPRPNWSAILASLREREADVREAPYLQSCIGVALANSGDVKNGLEVMRSSYAATYARIKVGQANPAVIDSWFANLRLIFPAVRTTEAEKFIRQVSDDAPTTRDLRWIAEFWFESGPDGGSRAIETAEKALATDDKVDLANTSRLYDIIGSVRFGSGDCPGALAAFGNALKGMPEEPSILNNYAFLAAECGDPKDAVAAAEKANRLAPNQSEFLDTLGYAQDKAGLRDAAIESYGLSIKAKPNASAHVHLAQILLEQGKKEEARSHLRAAGDLKPDSATQKQINDLIERLR
jgi:tetratricopeptide (TPR) repeat protein